MTTAQKIAYIIANTNLTAAFFDDCTTREVTALYRIIKSGERFAEVN